MHTFKIIVLVSVICAVQIDLASADDQCLFQSCECPPSQNSQIDVRCQNGAAVPFGFPSRNTQSDSTKINQFSVVSYNFTEIPDSIFDNLNIQTLALFNNKLAKIGKNVFQGVKGVKSLYVQRENSFQQIESGAFEPLSNLLKTLRMVNLNLIDAKLTSFSTEIQKLKVLEQIYFDSNNLTQIPADVFKGLGKLYSVGFNYNLLENIDVGAFSTNAELLSLEVNGNKLKSLDEIFKAVKPPGVSQISEIYAAGNSITGLATQTALGTLTKLRLQDNQITSFDDQSLPGCNALEFLDLSNNKLTFVGAARLAKMNKLNLLVLSNNQLTQVPFILNLDYLTNIDLSNQNGFLKKIPDYAFEKARRLNTYLTINLDENDIESFGDKPFCSRYFAPSLIPALTLSFKSMMNLNKCVLKQLNMKPITLPSEITISKPADPKTNLTQLCNCDLLLFADFHNLKIKGVCDSIFNTLTCNSTNYQDPCKNLPQFDCVPIFSSTTTSTTPRRTTSGGSRLSLNSLYPLIVLLSFLTF